MRRKDKEITDPEQMLAIIRHSSVCRVAMCDGDRPYVVPLSFGLDGDKIYFHSAREGRKLDIIRRNPKVCFEFDIDAEIIPADRNCDTGFRYRSIIGFGTAAIVEDPGERVHGLDTIMRQYGMQPSGYSETALASTTVVRIDIESMTGKQA